MHRPRGSRRPTADSSQLETRNHAPVPRCPLLAVSRLSGEELYRLRRETQHEHDDAEEAQHAPTRIERGGLIRYPGVTNPHDERDQRPDPPPRPPEAQHHQYGKQRPRDAPLPRPEQRVGDVPAVELAERQEVEGGHEQAEPRREPERMEEEVTTGRDGG